jgi:hypothetical protein
MRGSSVALNLFLMALAGRPCSSGTISTHLLPVCCVVESKQDVQQHLAAGKKAEY